MWRSCVRCWRNFVNHTSASPPPASRDILTKKAENMAKKKPVTAEDVSIVLCGEAGMGIQTVENVLTRMLKGAGYNVFATKEYMSRVRGGNNSTQIRVSSLPVLAFVNRTDVLVPL